MDLVPDAASARTLEPPGFALHALNDSGQQISHTGGSGRFAGRYPFLDDGQLID